MSFLESPEFRLLVERLVENVDETEAASLFHHRQLDQIKTDTEEGDELLVISCVPHSRPEERLDLSTGQDDLEGVVSGNVGRVYDSEWSGTGLLFYHDREGQEQRATAVHRRGEVVHWRIGDLVHPGEGVVPIRIVHPLYGLLKVSGEGLRSETPIQVDLSLMGVDGESIAIPTDRRLAIHDTPRFRQGSIHERQVVDDYDYRTDVSLAPLVNRLWQYARQEGYWDLDDEGYWHHWGEHFTEG